MQKPVSFKEAYSRAYPLPVAIAIAKDRKGKYNPITLGWVTQTSVKPCMFSIAISRANYSLEAIRFAREFVLAFPSADMAEEALFFGSCSGRDTDKLSRVKLATEPARCIDSLLLSDAVSNFECKLVSEHLAGDHVILVGEVVGIYMNADPSVERLYIIGPGFKMGSYRNME